MDESGFVNDSLTTSTKPSTEKPTQDRQDLDSEVKADLDAGLAAAVPNRNKPSRTRLEDELQVELAAGLDLADSLTADLQAELEEDSVLNYEDLKPTLDDFEAVFTFLRAKQLEIEQKVRDLDSKTTSNNKQRLGDVKGLRMTLDRHDLQFANLQGQVARHEEALSLSTKRKGATDQTLRTIKTEPSSPPSNRLLAVLVNSSSKADQTSKAETSKAGTSKRPAPSSWPTNFKKKPTKKELKKICKGFDDEVDRQS